MGCVVDSRSAANVSGDPTLTSDPVPLFDVGRNLQLGQAYLNWMIEGSTGGDLLRAVAATTNPGPIDLAAAAGFLYVETGTNGIVDELAVDGDGSLTPIGAVFGLPPGIEGIAAS